MAQDFRLVTEDNCDKLTFRRDVNSSVGLVLDRKEALKVPLNSVQVQMHMFGYDETREEVVNFGVSDRRVVFSVNEDKGTDFFLITVVHFLMPVKSDSSFPFTDIPSVLFV